MATLRTLGAIVDFMKDAAGPSATAGTTVPVVSAVDLTALMLSVVAEKTGYPADMLKLEMDLEKDLGIDSIKRVEILSAVTEQAPGLPAVDPGRMATLRTLGAIVDFMEGTTDRTSSPVPDASLPAANVAPAAPKVPAGTEAPQPAGLGRFVLERIAAPATGLAQPGLLDGGEVWVTGAGALDEAVAAELRSRGVNARATAALPDGARACVFLGGLRDVASVDEAIAVNRAAFAAARSLARELEAGRGLFVTVQDTGGTFGTGPCDPLQAWLSGLPALVKTASQEWPLASVKAIDLERAGRGPEELARAVAAELLGGGGEVEVALPAAGGRFTFRSLARPVEPSTPLVGEGDIVVVSGGGRGVTAACVAEWARDSRARFVLLGRTELVDEPACCRGLDGEADLKKALLADSRARGESPSPAALGARVRTVLAVREVRRTLEAIESVGGRARYETVAVEDSPAVAAVLARVRAEWGPVAAVVHAAGVLADRKISDKTDEQFDRVFDTKVTGLRVLLDATAEDPLKLLCVFSSVSARCGNNGQSDYAMANEVLAKVAASESARRPGALVKALQWGPWAGGMVGPELERRFASLGVPMIPLAVGARMFADEVRDGRRSEVEVVLGGEPKPEALLFAGSESRVQELEVVVGRKTHGFLEGHAVNGVPVVPVVLVAEWFSRAARSLRPGLELATLRDLKVFKGIRLERFDDRGDRLVLRARPAPAGSGTALELEVRSVDGTLHYGARAELLPELGVAAHRLPEPELGAWSGEPLYRELLFHRGAFELIEEIEGISDDGVRGRVRGLSRAGWPNGSSNFWHLDAAALDGGLQLALVHARRVLGGENLPTAIAELRRYSSAPASGTVQVTALRRKTGSRAVTTDLHLTDGDGRPFAALLGVEMHSYTARRAEG